MSNKYFSIPLYVDNTHLIERIGTNNSVKVFVFLKKEDFTQENEILLSKILQAINLNIDKDVQVLLLKPGQDAYIMDELDLSEENLFIGFGLNAKRLGLQCRTIPYKWMKLGNIKVLFSHTMSDLQSNVNFKKQLWTLLQQLSK